MKVWTVSGGDLKVQVLRDISSKSAALTSYETRLWIRFLHEIMKVNDLDEWATADKVRVI